jgi:hypothetical protein
VGLLQYLIGFVPAKSGAGFVLLPVKEQVLVRFGTVFLPATCAFPILSLRLLKNCLLSGGAAMILNGIEREFLSRLSFEPWTSPPVLTISF